MGETWKRCAIQTVYNRLYKYIDLYSYLHHYREMKRPKMSGTEQSSLEGRNLHVPECITKQDFASCCFLTILVRVGDNTVLTHTSTR